METGRRKFLCTVICATALACLISFGLTTGAQAETEKLTVRVMTRNMDAGTDLGYVATVTDPQLFALGLAATLAEVVASDIPGRAVQLASEIAETDPDLISLQEVTLWKVPSATGTVTLDQLELLTDALEQAGLHYRVAVVQELTNIVVNVTSLPFIQFTDRNAILVRKDLPPGHLDVMGTETHLFEPPLLLPTPLGEIPQLQGWIAADIKMRGARFKFVDTHLLSTIPGVQSTVDLQEAQAVQLIDGLKVTGLPVILTGDFNSDAEKSGVGPDQTPTADLISSAGYDDTWHALRPTEHGFTWALFLEDQPLPPPFNHPSTPFERIDLIFTRGPKPLSVVQTGTSPGGGDIWASDHTGVVATFDLQNHRPDVPVGRR